MQEHAQTQIEYLSKEVRAALHQRDASVRGEALLFEQESRDRAQVEPATAVALVESAHQAFAVRDMQAQAENMKKQRSNIVSEADQMISEVKLHHSKCNTVRSCRVFMRSYAARIQDCNIKHNMLEDKLNNMNIGNIARRTLKLHVIRNVDVRGYA